MRSQWRNQINTPELYIERVRVNSVVLSLTVAGVWDKSEAGEDQHNKRTLYGGSGLDEACRMNNRGCWGAVPLRKESLPF